MNFIILNGKKSTEVAGLMIQALPPVVKPPMRVQLDEVDGRDGDIITPLGFSGYDRTVKIGLRGVYDEDDIVEYFNSSGKVIFSNEPDKVYDYTIVESFSLDRLRKFREADVVFHVQPYKYSAVKEQIITASTISDCAQPLIPLSTYNVEEGSTSYRLLSYSDGNFALSIKQAVAGGSTNYGIGYKIIIPTKIQPGSYSITATIKSKSFTYGYLRMAVWSGDQYMNELYIANGRIDGMNPYQTNQYNGTLTITDAIDVLYVVFYCTSSSNAIEGYYRTQFDVTLSDLKVIAGNYASIPVINRGNAESAPVFSLVGVKGGNLRVNDGEIISITPNDATDIVIDSNKMQAYSGDTLKNRICTGNYANLRMKPGKNTVYCSAESMDSISISDYSRWI